MLNRTIYRDSDQWAHGATPLLKSFYSEEFAELQTVFKHLPSEEQFYRVVKMTRKDFQDTLLAAKDREKVIDRLYSPGHGGRKGVKSLKDSAAISRKNYEELQKLKVFVDKLGASFGMTAAQIRQQGGLEKLSELA